MLHEEEDKQVADHRVPPHQQVNVRPVASIC